MNTAYKTLEKPVKRRAYSSKKTRSKRIVKYQLTWDKICDKWEFSHKKEERKELRHSILIDLFGEEIELAGASHWQWDCIYLAQDFLLENGLLWWTKETAKCAVEEGLCCRYIWNIEHAGYDIKDLERYGAPEEYISSIASGKFHVRNWRALNSYQLWQLLITVKNRARSASNKGRTLYYNKEQPAEERGYVESDPDDFPF